MGFGINAQNGYLYDQESGNYLTFENLYIKASTAGNEIYAGRNEIVFDPAFNYKLIDRLFGFFLDKCQNSDDGDLLGGFIAYYSEDNPERKQRVVVKTNRRGDISSKWYWCIYLAYIDCIFAINEYNVDLSNFDVEPEFDPKTGKRIYKDK
jgi:hypothetical protein